MTYKSAKAGHTDSNGHRITGNALHASDPTIHLTGRTASKMSWDELKQRTLHNIKQVSK